MPGFVLSKAEKPGPYDELVTVLKVAKCAAVAWALAVVACLGVYLLWRGWEAFWTAFARLRWLGIP